MGAIAKRLGAEKIPNLKKWTQIRQPIFLLTGTFRRGTTSIACLSVAPIWKVSCRRSSHCPFAGAQSVCRKAIRITETIKVSQPMNPPKYAHYIVIRYLVNSWIVAVAPSSGHHWRRARKDTAKPQTTVHYHIRLLFLLGKRLQELSFGNVIFLSAMTWQWHLKRYQLYLAKYFFKSRPRPRRGKQRPRTCIPGKFLPSNIEA